MRKLALGLLALFLAFSPTRDVNAQAIGGANSILCNQSAPFTGTGSAAIVITGVANKVISVCGWHITNTAASGSFNISTGSGAGCGTGNTPVTGTLSVTSTAPSADHIDWATFSAAPGAGVCVNATVTTVTGLLWFTIN